MNRVGRLRTIISLVFGSRIDVEIELYTTLAQQSKRLRGQCQPLIPFIQPDAAKHIDLEPFAEIGPDRSVRCKGFKNTGDLPIQLIAFFAIQ